MRLHVLLVAQQAHKQLASSISWSFSSEIFSAGDDQAVQKWTAGGEAMGKVCVLDTFVSDLQCYPMGSKKQQNSSTDVVAVACTDGTLKLIGSNGRLEKNVEAHNGAVLSVRWSLDGSAIATSGEDGLVKVWSRAGMLRSTLAQADGPVYCVCWGGADANQLLFCSGCHVTIKSLQAASGGPAGRSSSSGQTSWKAHDALVLKADWNATTGLVVTAGEDCRYKVWDAFGRLLCQSGVWEQPITSLAWSPNGHVFAAGSFNCLALCDRQGWSYSQVRPAAGSLLGMCWSLDGTSLAACGGNGCLVLAAVLDVRVEDGRVVAVLEQQCVISVVDMLAGTRERLEFREPVIKMSLGCGHLVACTASQCHIYSTSNWNTPHIFDLREPVLLVLQCSRCCALLDASGSLQVFTYEGRPLCGLKPPGLRPEALNQQLISASNDTLALASGSSVRCYDMAQGRPVGGGVNHTLEIRAISLSQAGTATERLLALLDANGDLYLSRPLAQSSSSSSSSATAAKPVSRPSSQQQLVKLASNVTGAPVWHDSAAMLAAMVDSQLVVWHHAAAAFVDRDLFDATRSTHSDGLLGPGAALELFSGTSLLLRRRDGARVAAAIAPQSVLLHELARRGQWDKAVRLARFSRDDAVWSCLAAMAVAAGELATAEVACAAIDAVDKLQFVLRLRGLVRGAAAAASGDAVVAAELAAYRHQTDEAEAMLLQAGLLYQGIKLHMRLHHWQRALELAQQHKQHVDTVLMYRRRALAALGSQQETLPDFLALSQQVVDEAAVRECIRQDKAKEAQLRSTVAAASSGTTAPASSGQSRKAPR